MEREEKETPDSDLSYSCGYTHTKKLISYFVVTQFARKCVTTWHAESVSISHILQFVGKYRSHCCNFPFILLLMRPNREKIFNLIMQI